MKDELIKVIAEYLEQEILLGKEVSNATIHIATQITEKILPIVGEKDYPYNELFNHMANEHNLTLTDTELGDIIHIARGGEQKTGWEEINVGQRVRIIALLDHGEQDGHCLPIGHIATIEEIDHNDNDLKYRLNGHNIWVSFGEIEAIK